MSSLPVILKVTDIVTKRKRFGSFRFQILEEYIPIQISPIECLPQKDSHKKLIAVMCVSEYDQNFVATECHSHVMMISKVLL